VTVFGARLTCCLLFCARRLSYRRDPVCRGRRTASRWAVSATLGLVALFFLGRAASAWIMATNRPIDVVVDLAVVHARGTPVRPVPHPVCGASRLTSRTTCDAAIAVRRRRELPAQGSPQSVPKREAEASSCAARHPTARSRGAPPESARWAAPCLSSRRSTALAGVAAHDT